MGLKCVPLIHFINKKFFDLHIFKKWRKSLNFLSNCYQSLKNPKSLLHFCDCGQLFLYHKILGDQNIFFFLSRWLVSSLHTFLSCCKWWNWHDLLLHQDYRTILRQFFIDCKNIHVKYIQYHYLALFNVWQHLLELQSRNMFSMQFLKNCSIFDCLHILLQLEE